MKEKAGDSGVLRRRHVWLWRPWSIEFRNQQEPQPDTNRQRWPYADRI